MYGKEKLLCRKSEKYLTKYKLDQVGYEKVSIESLQTFQQEQPTRKLIKVTGLRGNLYSIIFRRERKNRGNLF